MERQDLKDLSKLKPAYSVSAIATDWVLIVGAMGLAQTYWHPAVYVVAVVVIGARQHALGVLLHEAAHFRIVNSRRLNDAVGEVLLAWPLMTTLHSYRKNHLMHHQVTNTHMDPDWMRRQINDDHAFPMTKRKFALICLGYLTGIKAFGEIKSAIRMGKSNPPPRNVQVGRLSLYAAIIALSIAFSFWKLLLLFWVIPFLTVFIFLLYIRGVAEHFAGNMDYSDLIGGTRNTYPTWLERFFIAPHHVGYHLDQT